MTSKNKNKKRQSYNLCQTLILGLKSPNSSTYKFLHLGRPVDPFYQVF